MNRDEKIDLEKKMMRAGLSYSSMSHTLSMWANQTDDEKYATVHLRGLSGKSIASAKVSTERPYKDAVLEAIEYFNRVCPKVMQKGNYLITFD